MKKHRPLGGNKMANRQNTADTTIDNRYNGWTNYETWAVSLWIDNDQATQMYWTGQAVEAALESPFCEMAQARI